MAERVKGWFDPEADFLEITFSEAPGYTRETENDAIVKRVDLEGNLTGFSILGVSQLAKSKPLMAELLPGKNNAARRRHESTSCIDWVQTLGRKQHQ